jgi:ComF family protein
VPEVLLRLFELVLASLSRNDCPACREPRPFQLAFCHACQAERGSAVSSSLGGLPVIALGPYRTPLDQAVRALKYDGAVELARPLGRELALRTREAAPSFDVVVPVPLHPARLVSRGYNHAALLGRELAKTLGVEFSARALERVRNTAAQARMRKAERKTNVAGVFVARASALPHGRRVALVDDVVTTGQTSLECCHALASAGFEPVAVLAIARAGGVVGPGVEPRS